MIYVQDSNVALKWVLPEAALAEREGCLFITADDKLVRNLQGRFPFIVPLASLP